MVRQQVFILEAQRERLKDLAARKGQPVAQLIRDGIELVIERESAVDDDSWREAIRCIEGMWEDRKEFDKFDAERRRRRAERRKRMNAQLSKWRA